MKVCGSLLVLFHKILYVGNMLVSLELFIGHVGFCKFWKPEWLCAGTFQWYNFSQYSLRSSVSNKRGGNFHFPYSLCKFSFHGSKLFLAHYSRLAGLWSCSASFHSWYNHEFSSAIFNSRGRTRAQGERNSLLF